MMQNIFIPTKKDLEDVVSRTVRETVSEALPGAIHKATRQKWLTTDDVMELLKCSRRYVQHIRDENLIEYQQTGRSIRYHIDAVEAYLNRGTVKARREE